MKLVALEEHIVTPAVLEAWRDNAAETADFGGQPIQEKLLHIGEGRLANMAEMGVDVQVLSLTSPGVQTLPAATATRLAGEANDLLAEAVRSDPAHFQAFATLPTPDPAAAAAELRRAVGRLGLLGAMVFGRTGDRNADHRDFDEIYATAAELRAPLYLQPQLPAEPVRKSYYDGYDAWYAGPGIGWHYETGTQLLRMVLGGVFDRHPDLQVIVGHWGEVILFYLERIATLDRVSGLQRPIADYFTTNVSYTGSGILSDRYLRWCIEVVGVERLLYSVDYPYIPLAAGAPRRFLEDADLSSEQKEAIGHGNWERLTAGLTAAA